MAWLQQLLNGQSVASALLILSLVSGTGLALGSIRVRGVGLGLAGVLFAGLLFGHLRVTVDSGILEFARELGLVLFVYAIGQQVGPGLLVSLRRQGLTLNLMSVSFVLLGVLTAVAVRRLSGVPVPVVAGMLAGGSTNTPSLAAAQQALAQLPAAEAGGVEARLHLAGLGYAVAYPIGVIGLILSMLALRVTGRGKISEEIDAYRRRARAEDTPLRAQNFVVNNPGLAGRTVRDIPGMSGQVVFSRLYREGSLIVPKPDTRLELGDVLLAVGAADKLAELHVVVGGASPMDLRHAGGGITARRIRVTSKAVLGKNVDELLLPERLGVTVTRIRRGDVELTPSRALSLQFGDTALVVGTEAAIKSAAAELGDSLRELTQPQMIPLFVGLALGVLVGSWPIPVPGLPVPLRLGLAGGPLLVAIVLSRLGRLGPLNWYLPQSANLMLRELGIVLFLASVGLRAGDRFVDTLVHGQGLTWLLWSAAITLVPLVVVGGYARLVHRLNHVPLCGFLAGSMTSPAGLAFSQSTTGNDGPTLAYATVYPLTMILRVLSAQMLVLLMP